ncbi:MAG: hypothetical protein AB7I50_04200 [Vicinamibacterales bacterium]
MRRSYFVPVLVFVVLAARGASGHSPICECYDNKDDATVTCEGGFSDGTSAEGASIRVVDVRERVLVDGKMDKKGTFTFKRPDQEFRVVFTPDSSHVVTILSEDIE